MAIEGEATMATSSDVATALTEANTVSLLQEKPHTCVTEVYGCLLEACIHTVLERHPLVILGTLDDASFTRRSPHRPYPTSCLILSSTPTACRVCSQLCTNRYRWLLLGLVLVVYGTFLLLVSPGCVFSPAIQKLSLRKVMLWNHDTPVVCLPLLFLFVPERPTAVMIIVL